MDEEVGKENLNINGFKKFSHLEYAIVVKSQQGRTESLLQ